MVRDRTQVATGDVVKVSHLPCVMRNLTNPAPVEDVIEESEG